MVINKLMRGVILVIVLLCGLGPLPASAALQAYVDRNPVAEDESFTLTLQSDEDLDGSPDLSPLRRDFEIENQGKSTSLTIINGSMTRKTQWQISLIPKHSGQLKIPPITVGNEQSQALTLNVTAASQAQGAQADGDLFMEVDVKPKTAYVQQQIIYTARLFSAVNLAGSSSLTEPSLPDGNAVVEKLGKDKKYQTLRNGMRYDVIERHYAIFPQKSGGVDIDPLVFDGDIVQSVGGGFFAFDPFNQNTRHKRLRSRAVHIDVKPMPAAFNGRQWLPARNVQVVETWSPDPPKFTVGQAVTRTVALLADGLTASQLPALVGGTIDGLKQYPDQPSLKDTQDGEGVSGLRTEKIAYIPSRAGKITLPAIEIPWWNTVSDRMEIASLPARTVTVAPAAVGSTPVSPPLPVVSTPTPQTTQAATTRPTSVQTPPGMANGTWPWIALLLGIGWLTTGVAWWWSRRRSMHIEPVPVVQDSLRQLEKALKVACFANDVDQAKGAVLAWARRRWPEHPPMSLTAVARRCLTPLSDALIELDRALYSRTASAWQGRSLWQQFVTYKPENEVKMTEQTSDLEPLYRSN